MAAFLESSAVIGQVADVRDLAWKQSKACGRAGQGFQGICDDIRVIFCDLQDLKEELANPKSFLKRCDHHTEVELRELLEECVEDLHEVEGFLNDLSPQRRNSIKPQDPDLRDLRKKICDRRSSFQDFCIQATTNALEFMKAQIFTLVEDILSERRSPYILTRIVDWDALTEELDHPVVVDRDALEFASDGDADSLHEGVIEILDSSPPASHSPSPERVPSDGSQQFKNTYRAPTVEDCVEGEDDNYLISPTTVPMSARNFNAAVDPDSHKNGPNGNSSKGSTGQTQEVDEDPLADPKRKPQRVDTEMELMQQAKRDIREEIRILKEEANMLEEQKRAWEADQQAREANQKALEAQQVQEFRNFRAGFTKKDEESILAECWRIPPESFKAATYFAMPNGVFYSAGTVMRHSTISPTPPLHNAFRRGSSYTTHNSGGVSGAGGSTGSSTGISSPQRRDSSFFGGLNGHVPRTGPFDTFEGFDHNSSDGGVGFGMGDGRNGRAWGRVAESPRDMSPVSDDRTPTPSQPQSPLPMPSSGKVVIEKPLPVTLEEVFRGTRKTAIVEREICDERGLIRKERKELSVPVRKGVKPGRKITFPRTGNQGADGVAQDICFVVEEIPHRLFRREGSDLRMKIRISDAKAQARWKREVPTICGRKLVVRGPKHTHDGWEQPFPGYGMPRSSDPSRRGDLIVEVEVRPTIEHSGVI